MRAKIRRYFSNALSFLKRRLKSLWDQIRTPLPEVLVGTTLGAAWARLTVATYLFIVAIIWGAPLLALAVALYFLFEVWTTYHLSLHFNIWLSEVTADLLGTLTPATATA